MQQKTNDAQLFWKKKEFLSFILSTFVFLIHISSFSQYSQGSGVISVINEKTEFFFTESITRFAVPMFYILSGITFFRDYSTDKYLSKVKSRIFSLVIPYLIWNTLWMLFDIACSYTFISRFFIGRKAFELSFSNILKGIFLHECNIPFWYIKYLIVFVLLSPLFDSLLRTKYIGIFSLSVLFILYIFREHIPFVSQIHMDYVIYYTLGAWLGKHHFALLTRKSGLTMQLLSAGILAVYILAKNLLFQTLETDLPAIGILLFTLCAFSLWNLTDLFIDKIRPRALYTRSFAMLALHTNVSAVITKLFAILLPRSELLAIPNFLFTFVSTILCISLFCSILERFSPRIYSILMGNRIKKA